MKAEVKKQFSPLERVAIDVIEEKFEELSENCEYRFIDDRGIANCRYHDSSIGYCKAEFCPRLNDGGEKDEAEGD